MGSRTQGSSDTASSEENDRQEPVKEDAATTATAAAATAKSGTKRSYECTFCKRGFTNAQALGGHMNIHRKDRAKTKHVIMSSSSSSISINTNEEYMNPNYMGSIPNEPLNYYQVLESERNYPMYFPPSGSGTSSSPSQLPQGYNYHGSHDHFLVQRNQSLNMNEQLWGANLSLQIGSDHLYDNGMNMEVAKEDEVDLELRLGHDRKGL